MEIPYTALSPETLRGVIEEFITREGTDYGEEDYSLEQKISQVMQQLKSGLAVIVYSEETETTAVVLNPGYS